MSDETKGAREAALEVADAVIDVLTTTIPAHVGLSRSLIADAVEPFFPAPAGGAAPEWEQVNGFKVRWDEDAKVFVGEKIILSQATTKERAIEAVRSAICSLADIYKERFNGQG